MKKNNKGFIAISLIYSFFLVFLVTLLAIVNEYAHNRVLLNDVKKETQEYLNGLAEFNPVHLENREYEILEEIPFASEKWNVIHDDGTFVTLLLNRSFSELEIIEALENVGIKNVQNNDSVLMCLSEYNPFFCNYTNSVTFNYYRWDSSIVKKIVEYWFSNNATLQKAVQVMTLQNMTFTEGERNYNSYIRIPLANEYDTILKDDIWYLTRYTNTNGISYIKFGTNEISTHNHYKKISPVIMVKKST